MTGRRFAVSLTAVIVASVLPFIAAARLQHGRTTSPDGQFSVDIPAQWQATFSTPPSNQGWPNQWVLDGPGSNGVMTASVSWIDNYHEIGQGYILEDVLAGYQMTVAGQSVHAGVDHDPGGCCPQDRNLRIPTLTRTVDGADRQYFVGCNEPNGTARDDATCLAILETWRWETPSSTGVPLLAAALGGAVMVAAGIAFLGVRHRQGRRRSARA